MRWPRTMPKRLAAVVAAGAMSVMLGGCSAQDVLDYLAGCPEDGGTSSVAASSGATGEWTEWVGMTEAQIKAQVDASDVSYCATYNSGFQCTWWACIRERSLGHQVGQYWGNGNQWGASARSAGWVEGAAVGGIISFAGGVHYNSGSTNALYGHVAVIDQIDGDTIHLTEGGTGFGKVHTTTMSASSPPSGVTFWHPADTGGIQQTEPQEQDADTGGTAAAAWTCRASTDTASATADVTYEGDGTHATPAQAQAIARQMIASGYKAWDTDEEWEALVWVWNHESGWRWDADNPTSDAYGIPQALPGSKMADAGADWKDNAATQIKWGLGYIRDRYGSPSKAKAFWLSHNWY